MLLHCSIISLLWEIFFTLVGVCWVFHKTVKEALLSRGSFVGRKKKKDLEFYPPVHLLDGLQGEKSYSILRWEFNCIEFKEFFCL